MTLPTTDAPSAPRDRSTAQWWGRLLDGAFFGILAALAWGIVVVVAQGGDSMQVVQSAATAPISIARAAMSTPEPQQYIERTEWTRVGDQVSLRVYPTEAGRRASAGFFDSDGGWAQVLALSPDADKPGMREQFVCHWRFAELVEPGKVSWNLEPWRPIVNGASMIESRCNPGAAEETF